MLLTIYSPTMQISLFCGFTLNTWSSSLAATICYILVAVATVSAVIFRPKSEDKQYVLFVYGTLKRGFHWNHKFLSRSKFVSQAITEDPFPMIIGQCGVPYLISDLPGCSAFYIFIYSPKERDPR